MTILYREHISHSETLKAKSEFAQRIVDNDGDLKTILHTASQVYVQDAIELLQMADECVEGSKTQARLLEYAENAHRQGQVMWEMSNNKSIIITV